MSTYCKKTPSFSITLHFIDLIRIINVISATVPVLLRDQDFREANLTSLLNWIEWLDGMRATLLAMKEKTTSCKSHSYEELRGYASVTQMLKDIQDALKTVDQCENKLHEQLRDSGKQWNYPVEKKPGVG